MESLDYWRLCDELTVIQSALLIVGCDPSGHSDVERWVPYEQPNGYPATKAALTHAILSGRLRATIRRAAWERGWDEEPDEGERLTRDVRFFESDITGHATAEDRTRLTARGVIFRAEPDWDRTTVQVDHLRQWLLSRGIRTGFFFPGATDAPDYLDGSNPRYAPKLAAAVQGWRAVTDPGGKHPKGALLKWLREHAAEFGLTNDDGKINEQGVEEVAKVANWQPGGGAPKTPGS